MIIVRRNYDLDLINETFVDYLSKESQKMTYLRNVGGIPVIARPHAESRYNQRVAKLQKIGIKIKSSREYYTSICNYLKSIESSLEPKIKGHTNTILHRTGYTIKNIDNGEYLLLEIACIMNSSYPTFKDKSLKAKYLDLLKSNVPPRMLQEFLLDNCSSEYEDLLRKGFIKPNKPVVSLSTVVTALSDMSTYPVTFSNHTNIDEEYNEISNKEILVDTEQLYELANIVESTPLVKYKFRKVA